MKQRLTSLWSNWLKTQLIRCGYDSTDDDKLVNIFVNFELRRSDAVQVQVKAHETEIRIQPTLRGESTVDLDFCISLVSQAEAAARETTDVASSPWFGSTVLHQLRPRILDDVRAQIAIIAEEYEYVITPFKDFLRSNSVQTDLMGPDLMRGSRQTNKAKIRGRQTDRPIDRHAEAETDREGDRETDTEPETDRDRDSENQTQRQRQRPQQRYKT